MSFLCEKKSVLSGQLQRRIVQNHNSWPPYVGCHIPDDLFAPMVAELSHPLAADPFLMFIMAADDKQQRGKNLRVNWQQ